jgi:molecular chaperone HscB
MSHPDHFALLALPARFAIDEAALERAHKEVQSKVHPDRHAAASAAGRRVAMQWAARANEAFRTLRSPLSRAQYLCERAGVLVDAGSNSAMPAEFLVQQMNWRESLEDSSRDPASLDSLESTMKSERDRLIAEIGQAIDERGDHAAASQLVRQLMFVERFAEDISAAREAHVAGRRQASA